MVASNSGGKNDRRNICGGEDVEIARDPRSFHLPVSVCSDSRLVLTFERPAYQPTTLELKKKKKRKERHVVIEVS